MIDPSLDRAAQFLAANGQITMGVADLACALGYAPADPSILAQRLRQDERFIVLDRGALPGLDRWRPEHRASYAAALGQADLLRPCLVLLRPTGTAGDRDRALLELLHRSALDLAASHDATALTCAAQRTRDALTTLFPATDRGSIRRPGPAAPSTSPPPGPRRPASAPPPWRLPAPTTPPPPGSRPARSGHLPSRSGRRPGAAG
jgi:hypothetical protein